MGEVNIVKTCGGGTSWFYAMQEGKALGASHEDDKSGMDRLREIRQISNKELANKTQEAGR